MMCYKDMTFCPGPCGNKCCLRHKSIVDDAYKEGGFLNQNSWMPVSWYVEIPEGCQEWVKEND